jgi:ATP-dependent Clp protease adapter protein ClpS
MPWIDATARTAVFLDMNCLAEVLERPGLDLSRPDSTPQTDPGRGAGDYDRSRGTGGGSFRLLLLHSEKNNRNKVVAALTTVVPGITPEAAENCYETAKQLGMAMVTTCLKEHAEFYALQLYLRGCRARIEPDTSTL